MDLAIIKWDASIEKPKDMPYLGTVYSVHLVPRAGELIVFKGKEYSVRAVKWNFDGKEISLFVDGED